MYHGKRYTFTVGAVSEEEAGNKSRQVDYLELVYPKHDEKPPFQTRAEIERKITAGGLARITHHALEEWAFCRSK